MALSFEVTQLKKIRISCRSFKNCHFGNFSERIGMKSSNPKQTVFDAFTTKAHSRQQANRCFKLFYLQRLTKPGRTMVLIFKKKGEGIIIDCRTGSPGFQSSFCGCLSRCVGLKFPCICHMFVQRLFLLQKMAVIE